MSKYKRYHAGGLKCERVEPKSTEKTITNIYYDCLERIFDYLDLESLLSVAGTCKRLQVAAAAKFSDEFAHKSVHLYLVDYNEQLHSSRIELNVDHISVVGAKLCFSLLRCFGAKIRHLGVSYVHVHDIQCDNLDDFINQYCANTLIGLSLACKRTFKMECFEKPFTSIERVEIYGGDLRTHMVNFVKWFPNLRHLEMNMFITYDETAMAVRLPKLEHLTITTYNRNVLFNILCANRQLQSVRIISFCVLSLGEILNTIAETPLISKLGMDAHITQSNVSDLNRFVFERPSTRLPLILCHGDDAIELMRQLNALKRFEFKLKNRLECDRYLKQLDDKWQHTVWVSNGSFYISLKR